jgi:hypothetical protein
MAPPPHEKGILEKLDDKYRTIWQPSPPRVRTQHGKLPPPVSNRKNAAGGKVMSGAADRMENLLPRN